MFGGPGTLCVRVAWSLGVHNRRIYKRSSPLHHPVARGVWRVCVISSPPVFYTRPNSAKEAGERGCDYGSPVLDPRRG